ncbi:DUF4303 domain-containing protein [Affinibrenneria salicis]|uniref:DUF4303 domain-containing protein n=1 Tax=Affinibrenneria salicis TaxID=2590031 RepID=A0A5J5FXU2_9GAMM|nr:DUF4303 domain-containing protein [Affinibrenneria salicis]KAA8998932.1 DUF4303 domain-containing protein [Affinibrenneria salicis]
MIINLNIDRVASCFLRQIERAASVFSSHAENRQIYAFCLDLDIENGGCRVSWNSLAALDATLAGYRQRQSQRHSELDIDGVSGIKYNSGDFSYHLDELDPDDDGVDQALSEIMAQLGALYDEKGAEFYQQYYQSVVEKEIVSCAAGAILRAQTALSQFDQCADFIAFVTLHDADDEHLLGIMRQTVDDAVLADIFG